MEIVEALLADKKAGTTEAFDSYSAQLEEANVQLAQAKEEISQLKEPSFYKFDRFEASADYSSFYVDAQKIDSIAKVIKEQKVAE